MPPRFNAPAKHYPWCFPRILGVRLPHAMGLRLGGKNARSLRNINYSYFPGIVCKTVQAIPVAGYDPAQAERRSDHHPEETWASLAATISVEIVCIFIF